MKQKKGLSREVKIRNIDVKPKTNLKTSDFLPPKPIPNHCIKENKNGNDLFNNN